MITHPKSLPVNQVYTASQARCRSTRPQAACLLVLQDHVRTAQTVPSKIMARTEDSSYATVASNSCLFALRHRGGMAACDKGWEAVEWNAKDAASVRCLVIEVGFVTFIDHVCAFSTRLALPVLQVHPLCSLLPSRDWAAPCPQPLAPQHPQQRLRITRKAWRHSTTRLQ